MDSCSHSLPSSSQVLKDIKSKIRGTKSHTPNRSLPDELCYRISLSGIKAATNNFHKATIIAKGDMGFIYGGKINDEFYAITRLMPTTDSHLPLKELRHGAELLCQLRHPNILSLIGFCDEKKEMIHVYQHVNNGSLYDNLHVENRDPIPWKRRLEICIGVARALHYLHTGAKCVLIHRDVSSKNILLDDQWTSKLCNFGFCKRGPLSTSRGTVSIEVESDLNYNFACLAAGYRTNVMFSHSGLFCSKLCVEDANSMQNGRWISKFYILGHVNALRMEQYTV